MLSGNYRKSPFVQEIRDNGRAVIWHSLFGKPKVVSRSVLDFINSFRNHVSLASMVKKHRLDRVEKEYIDQLINDHYLIPDGLDERRLLDDILLGRMKKSKISHSVNYLGLIMSEGCNFRCDYCFHFNNLENSDRIYQKKKLMSFSLAQRILDFFFGVLRQNRRKRTEINFGGGEPLLNWPTIKEVITYCREKYGEEFDVRYTINTNASLITAEIATTLKSNRVAVATSIDGIGFANDLVRHKSDGQATFDMIVDGLRNLSKVGHPVNGFSATVNHKNFPHINENIIDWAVERKMKEVRIDIDVIGMVDVPIDTIASKLKKLISYGENNGVNITGFWARPVENLNDSLIEKRVVFCGGAKGSSICVNPAGDFFYCGYSAVPIGNIAKDNQFFDPTGRYAEMVRSHLSPPDDCKGCIIEGQCLGGCQITREYAEQTRSQKVERMCDFYRTMTKILLISQLRNAL